MKSLVLYYSRAAENYFGGKLIYIEKGNTEVVAEKIAAMTGADLFQCEQLVPYADDYKECVAKAREDWANHARPAIKPFDKDITEYETVYICYPNYCGTLPMAMFTLLESIDFSGKIVKPLCTNEGSGMGQSETDIKALCKNAQIEKGLAIKGSMVNEADAQLKGWI